MAELVREGGGRQVGDEAGKLAIVKSLYFYIKFDKKPLEVMK